MDSYTIGQIADRSGFPASALRYYEGIGLLPPAGRSSAGYRLYDGHALARLSFIARAKQLGCSLEEITDLVDLWDGERCGPVQRRLHELVTAKLGDAVRQIGELTAFIGQLEDAATQLAGEPVDGPCDEGCACLLAAAASVEVPIACTLESGAMTDHLADWNRVLAAAVRRWPLPTGGMRIEFEDVDVAELGRLVVAEQACCAFFRFAITVDRRGVALEVDAPADARDLVTGLFGSAS